MLIKPKLIKIIVLQCLIVLVICPFVYATIEINNEVYFEDLTKRQLERYLQKNYHDSYDQFVKSSIFYDFMTFNYQESYKFYHFETRIIRSSFFNLDFLTKPFNNFFEMIPYEDYYDIFDQYYLSDIEILSLSDWGKLRINLSDLTQGDYFMKLNINFFRIRN
ncbi:MAG: hypothetical protein K0B81_01845 [Candidatus Cloacimonetes bacterium]|nr:hypothetical protein [Candidatus Cloacimonadota bacterium]